MKSKTVSFKQVWPISFAKFLVQKIGEPEMCKRLHNGNYPVKCTSKDQSDKFLSISQIGSIEVETFPHERLNAVKGVRISTWRLENECSVHLRTVICPRTIDVYSVHVFFLYWGSIPSNVNKLLLFKSFSHSDVSKYAKFTGTFTHSRRICCCINPHPSHV